MGRNPADLFAFFRGRYWRVNWHQFLHDYMEVHTGPNGTVEYPIRNNPYLNSDLVPIPMGFRHRTNLDANYFLLDMFRPVDTHYFRSIKKKVVDRKIDWNKQGF